MSSPQIIADGKVVSIQYTLRNGDGEVLDQSTPGDPLHYLHGAGNIVPGLERQLTGLAVGARLSAAVPPAEGYGEANPEGRQRIPKSAFGGIALEPGLELYTHGPDGSPLPLWVVGVGIDTVEVDFNHPLAGQTLHFAVEVLALRDATADEMTHGHAHGPTGHEGHHH
jgi:FKBP-type peptidyl-prolyl cis-trans isomerase SlyD